MQSQLDIATATGVDISLNIAGPGARSYAFIIDWHIRVLIALAWFLLFTLLLFGSLTRPEESSVSEEFYALAVIFPSAAIYGLYHIVLEVVMRGRTPGKRIAGVRITTLDGHEPGFLALVIRNVLRLIDSAPFAYAIGLGATLLTRNAVRVGDLAAGTLLIYDLSAHAEKGADAPANAAAVSRFGLEKTELAQDLLNRWDTLDTDRRSQLGARLISQLDPLANEHGNDRQLRNTLERLIAEAGEA